MCTEFVGTGLNTAHLQVSPLLDEPVHTWGRSGRGGSYKV